jgi:hypothetical protein
MPAAAQGAAGRFVVVVFEEEQFDYSHAPRRDGSARHNAKRWV